MRGLLYVLASPIALPFLGGTVAYGHWAVALGWRERKPRFATWYWRMWWFYGYNFGLYRIDWAMKRRLADR